MNSPNRFLFILATCIALMAGLGNTSGLARFEIDGFMAVATDEVSFDPASGKLNFENGAGGLSINVEGTKKGQVLLDPVEIQVGESFYSNIIEESGLVFAYSSGMLPPVPVECCH